MTKNFYLYDRFLCQIEILLLNMLKLLNIPDFLFKIPGFSMFFSNFPKFQVFPGFFLTKLSNSRSKNKEKYS